MESTNPKQSLDELWGGLAKEMVDGVERLVNRRVGEALAPVLARLNEIEAKLREIDDRTATKP